jgi:hypothetical protein
MFVVKHNGRACAFRDSSEAAQQEAGASRCNMAQSTRQTFGVPSQGVLIESSDKVVRLSEARYTCETRLWELEQQFEVKAAKVREEYLAAVLEIHATEATGNQHAHHS